MGAVSLKRRLWTMASLAVVLPLGFLLKFYTGPGQDWLNNSVAGLAYVIFWCLVFFFVWPSRRAITPIVAGVLLVTCVLETLQLWHPPFLEVVRSHFLGRALIGNSFAWTDFPYYVIGSAIGWLWLSGIAQIGLAGDGSS